MNSLIKQIGKHLPAFVKKPVAQLYQRWSSKIIYDKELIRDLMEYYNLSYDETKCMVRLGPMLALDFWKAVNPKTDSEILSYYKMPRPYSIFPLAYWHMGKGQRQFRKEVMKYCLGDVLDYGGGIGDLSVQIAEKGLNVTYADLNGDYMKFAKWLFKQRGKEDITVLDIEDQEKVWSKEYDTIVCIDVIEHIPHPEVVLVKMAKHLKNNGRIIITNLECAGATEDAPMHFKIDFDAEKLLNSLGVFKSEVYDWLWVKKDI